MAYGARILKDSISASGVRLITMEITFPRFVLAEFNTHRMLSRNSASSRAIPVEKRIAMVKEDPFVPAAFGRNQKGMQAGEALSGDEAEAARADWLDACDDAITHAQSLAKRGVHKQLANRLIEPFCWHTVIVSGTEWLNFFALRCHPMAQPEIRTIAEMMSDLVVHSRPEVPTIDWHLPLTDDLDRLQADGFTTDEICRISVGRCARVSYLTHDGDRDPIADIQLADRLKASGHMSPFEHVATPILGPGPVGNFWGWMQYRKTIPGEAVFSEAKP